MRQDAPVLRRLAAAILVLAAVAGGCTLDRAELFDGGGTIASSIDDLRVLTYRDDPATDEWIDVVTPDAAVVEEGDAFREDDSRTAGPDEAADARRLFTRVGEGRTVLVQLDRRSGDLLVWEFVDGSNGPISAAGTADDEQPNEVADGGHLTVLREADAGTATVVIDGNDDIAVEEVASHGPDDGVDLHVDVYTVSGSGRATITYADDSGTTTYDVIVV